MLVNQGALVIQRLLIVVTLILAACQRALPAASVPDHLVMANGSLDYANAYRRGVALSYSYCVDQGAALSGVGAAQAPTTCRCVIDTLYSYPSNQEADALGRAILDRPLSDVQSDILATVRSNMDAEGSRRCRINFSLTEAALRAR